MNLNALQWGAACRRVVARYPLVRWGAVITVAIAVGAAVHTQVGQLDAAKDAWGQRRQVAVAAGDHSPGDVVSFQLVDVPSMMVPASALASVEPGAFSRQHLADGEVLVAVDVSVADGPTALAPPGTTVVALTDHSGGAARIGDHVTVFSEGLTLTDDALVTHLEGDHIFIAVLSDQAPLVAHAARAGTATLGFNAGS